MNARKILRKEQKLKLKLKTTLNVVCKRRVREAEREVVYRPYLRLAVHGVGYAYGLPLGDVGEQVSVERCCSQSL